jgi:hypothetical protein
MVSLRLRLGGEPKQAGPRVQAARKTERQATRQVPVAVKILRPIKALPSA